MPNNENKYRIKLEYISLLKDLPGFRIINREPVGFVNVATNYACSQGSLTHFFGLHTQLLGYSQSCLIDQLFRQLEKDQIDLAKLPGIATLFKKYLRALKQIDTDLGYYIMTPGIVAGVFLILHLILLFFPANKTFIYASLMASLYSLGFWLFSVWSFSQHAKTLYELENSLSKKINCSKPSSFFMVQPTYDGESESILPVAALKIDRRAATSSASVPNFFSVTHPNSQDGTDFVDSFLQERCYSTEL